MDISPYVEHALRRVDRKRRLLTQRREQAWRVARDAARVLQEEFGAARVAVFGSLAGRSFGLWSDIDLAVSGVSAERFFEAVSRVLDTSTEFKMDLVDLDSCRPSLRRTIERQSILL